MYMYRDDTVIHVDLLKDMMDHRDSDSKPILCDIQSDSLLILSCLCQLDNHRKVEYMYITVHNVHVLYKGTHCMLFHY